MRRKVAGRLRLSPNEEAQLLKEEHERRRKLRLQQVREQERNIALQIRQDVKQRRDEHLNQLAEELETEWQKTQDEKIKALEDLYLSSLRAIGEGHREAKENEPDLEALAKQAEERKETAKKRYKEALKEQKNQKEKLLRDQTRRANARKHAFDVERERASRVASLPPPPPHPFENIELKNTPTVKMSDVDSFSISRHHIFDPYVNREMNTEQPDARLLAEEEAKQKEELQNDKERERREQLEKAYLRGKHALKMVRLARDKEKLMKELEQMQNIDLAHRRRIVAQMPPQLFEPTYRRVEIKEEWQRELECAFEDMYTGNMKMKGDLILHLDPQPLPAFSDGSQDDELELSQEPEPVCELPQTLADEMKDNEPSGGEVEKSYQPPAKLALKKLLNKIRSQKDNWTSRCESETQSDIGTIESGTISSRGEKMGELESVPEPESKNDPAAEPSEEFPEILNQTIVAGNALTKHAQEQTTKIRKESERSTQTEWQQQQQTEEQKTQSEVDFLSTKVQHQEQEAKTEQEKKDQECQTEQHVFDSVTLQKQEAECKTDIAPEPQAAWFPKEGDHLKRIHDCQQRLLMQNRLHQESVDEARRHLEEYQNRLKQRFQSVSIALLNPVNRLARLNSLPKASSQAQEFDQSQRMKLMAYKPSENASVQELGSSGQKTKEQRLELASDEQAQPRVDSERRMQLDQGCFHLAQGSSSHREKEKLDVVGTPVAQSLEFHRIPRSLLPKPADSSATTQPVALIQNAPFTFPAAGSPGHSETLSSESSISDKPLAEKILLPTFLKDQDIPKESRINVASNQTHHFPLHSISSSPSSVMGKTEGIQESSALKIGSRSLSSCSDIVELKDRLLASSESIEVQQEHLKELQEQLDKQREALLVRQKIQEDVLLQKHAQLKQQMEQQQEALKEIIKRATWARPCSEMTEAKPDSFSLLSGLPNEAKDGTPNQVHFSDMTNRVENCDSVVSMEQTGPFQSVGTREERPRLSKPPLVKVKPGLDLEQHELSAILELDTPKSDVFSSTGNKQRLTGDLFLTPKVDKLPPRKSPAESLQEEIDLLRIISIADDEELNSGESLKHIHGSCSDKLTGKASGLDDSVHSKEFTSLDQSLSNYPADNGRIVACPDPSLRPNSQVVFSNAWSPGLLTATTRTQQVANGNFSSTTLSAANFIKNYNPDNILAGTESCSARQQSSFFSFPTKENSTTALFLQKPSENSPNSCLSFEEMDSDGSKIQQIIDKYRKDFSWSSLSSVSSFHDPTVGLDTTDFERSFPNFHRELFQPLKPSSDFDISSTLSRCRISHNSKDLSKASDLTKIQDLTASILEEGSNGTLFLNRGKLSSSQLKEQSNERINQPVQVAEELSEHLSLETSLHKSFGKPGAFCFKPEENLELSKSIEDSVIISPETVPCEELQDDSESRYFCSSIENFHSLNPVEDQTSIYQMIPGFGTRKPIHGRTESAKEDSSSRAESLSFVELATTSSDKNNEMVTRNRLINDDVETDLAQRSLNSTQGQSFLRSKVVLSWPQEINSSISGSPLQNSVQESISQPAVFPQPNMDLTQVKSSDSCLSQCNIPVWEALTGRGIMEEPELTLVSSNDISTAESELLHSDHSEVRNCPQSRGFFPLNPEVDELPTQLDYLPPTPSPQNYLDQKSKPRGVILSELAPVQGSLQESFLKRKKDFIERSLKRMEKLKNQERSSGKAQIKASQPKKPQLHKRRDNWTPLGAAVNHLKKVEEKGFSPAGRKAAAVRMQQRTSRLYNNLTEVKNRKEEKDRRENYARNRERAKEFQKKTLEKLRARKTNLKT